MIAEECKYTNEHEWVFVDGEIASIGISEFAADSLGELTYVELPDVGSKVHQMDPIGTVESRKGVEELFSPLSGEVLEVNEEAVQNPELINKSPFDEGWLLKIRMSDAGELDNLYSYEEYQGLLSEVESEESEEEEVHPEEEEN
jgi:glycine cleavage system H protein